MLFFENAFSIYTAERLQQNPNSEIVLERKEGKVICLSFFGNFPLTAVASSLHNIYTHTLSLCLHFMYDCRLLQTYRRRKEFLSQCKLSLSKSHQNLKRALTTMNIFLFWAYLYRISSDSPLIGTSNLYKKWIFIMPQIAHYISLAKDLYDSHNTSDSMWHYLVHPK